MTILKRYFWSILATFCILVACLIPIPEIKPLEDVPLMDKWTHFVMFGGLACAVWYDIWRSRIRYSVMTIVTLAIVLPVIYGGLTELAQAYLTTCRQGDWLDCIANTIGVIIAIPIGLIMKRIKHLAVTAALTMLTSGMAAQTDSLPPLRDAFADKFLIGAALNTHQVRSQDPRLQALIRREFSSVVAENCMKSGSLQPREGVFRFDEADRLADLAEKNGQALIGHCLIWHSQAPRWFFTDSLGNKVSREVLIERMRTHIHTVVTHFKGKVKGWDVVNEAIEWDGSWRKSDFYNIIGPEFINLAFKFAHEADPEVELYYNDYSMDGQMKRDAVVRMVRNLKADGLRIDAVGMQSHLSLGTSLDEYEKSLMAFAAEGVKVMATELDLSVLPWPHGNNGAAVETNFEYQEKMNPYRNGLTPEMEQRQTEFFKRLFAIYLRHADHISRVTFWGVSDGDSWKNNWPVRGRTDYPLAFDRQLRPKPFVREIMKLCNVDR